MAPTGERLANAASSSSTDERFNLSGPSVPLDARLNAYRSDLADIGLAGRILAPHYARPLMRACGAHATYVRGRADGESAAISELLPGEDFAVLEYAGGWAWGYCAADHVVGYVEAITLAAPQIWTHIVCEKWAPVAPDARITAPVLAGLPMGARLHGEECGACLSTEYGCVPLSHLRPIAEPCEDPVAVAERLIGAPYLEGGRGPAGVDAAGLIQLALGLSGIEAPRFVEQLAVLGAPVPSGAPLRPGDLIVADSEAGLMIDDLMLIHASRSAGKVTTAPYAAFDGPDTARRRLF
ncbi:NlpC/P60 family protein [Sphingosinicella sp. LHD-64]|uniref:C40 family peptidase n=1 Tax=Sphingosinicella sp. LHD-64 TaxID=3072139 RepID=UPI00280F098F|nr:NlpC/P60 family protein [Sphingosinicella sp. LHD-64]MDQ8755530.1 NlpC/P60 family protein [Sphingosinicella sp. LHD-64]